MLRLMTFVVHAPEHWPWLSRLLHRFRLEVQRYFRDGDRFNPVLEMDCDRERRDITTENYRVNGLEIANPQKKYHKATRLLGKL